MSSPIRIGVFGGTVGGNNPKFEIVAKHIGTLLGKMNYSIIFGGGSTGIMGAVAVAALETGATVIGVLPRGMAGRNDTLLNATEIIISGNMHQRKETIYHMTDAFVVLPGGLGTLDEFIETLTWCNLNIHNKPIILVNIDSYWDPVLDLFKKMIEMGFVNQALLSKILVVSDPEEILNLLESGRYEKKGEFLNDVTSSIVNIHYAKLFNCLSSFNLALESQNYAGSLGFDWNNSGQAFNKVKEELNELEEELIKQVHSLELEEEYADLLYAVINLGRHLKINPINALEKANLKFAHRFSLLQKMLDEDGIDWFEASLTKKLEYWQLAKNAQLISRTE